MFLNQSRQTDAPVSVASVALDFEPDNLSEGD
jgi:hypothetical protein